MKTIRFQHTDRARTAAYRVDFYAPGDPTPAHTFQSTSVTQIVSTPPTFEIPPFVMTPNLPPAGIYEVTVTAVNGTSSATSERTAPTPTEAPLTAPTTVTVTY